jgi:hypothetical protein
MGGRRERREWFASAILIRDESSSKGRDGTESIATENRGPVFRLNGCLTRQLVATIPRGEMTRGEFLEGK